MQHAAGKAEPPRQWPAGRAADVRAEEILRYAAQQARSQCHSVNDCVRMLDRMAGAYREPQRRRA